MNTNQERTREIFRGSFEECLVHYSRGIEEEAPKFSNKANDARRPLANFCSVEVSCVYNWLRGKTCPTGEPRLKTTCFLDLHGYRIVEFENLEPTIRHFGELWGYGVLDRAQVTRILAYVMDHAVFRVINGRESVGQERKERMWKTWLENKKALKTKKEEWLVLLGLDALKPNTVAIATAKTATALTSLLELCKPSDFSAEDRVLLSSLHDQLNRFSSESLGVEKFYPTKLITSDEGVVHETAV